MAQALRAPGSFPTSDLGLQALASEGFLKGSRVPKDPWKRSYIYMFPGQHNQGEYDLSSQGETGGQAKEAPNNWGPPCLQ